MMRRTSGSSFLEAMAFLVLLGILLTIAIPSLGVTIKRYRLRDASRHMIAFIRQTRMMAAMRGRYTAIRFFKTSGRFRYSIVEDGNGNGVLESEIKKNIDKEILASDDLSERFPGIEVRIVSRSKISKIPPAGGYLEDLGDPVKFGNSDLISFSPLGFASNGTLYLSSGNFDMVGVKVFGPGARIQTWTYDYLKDSWKRLQ